MFFALSKLVGFFVQPSNMLIAIGLLGVLVTQTRFSRGGQRILIGSILMLAVCGFSPIGNWTLRSLEQRFPPWDEKHGAPDGIIVLGGVISYGTSMARPYPGINDAAIASDAYRGPYQQREESASQQLAIAAALVRHYDQVGIPGIQEAGHHGIRRLQPFTG